jgi:uncharacterized protein YggE
MRIASLCFLGLSALIATAPTVSAQCNQNCPDRRTISVNGTAIVTADADLAIVRVGYKLFAADAKTVYTSATEASNAIMQALIAAGVPKSAIESTSQIIHHTEASDLQWYPNPSERTQREFVAVQSWAIRVKPDEAAKVLNSAILAGANESGWIEWVLQHPESLQAEASAEAGVNARATAERIAKTSGVRLGQLVSVMENQGPPAANAGWGGGFVIAGLSSTNQPLQINSRRVQFQASVFAVFAIE